MAETPAITAASKAETTQYGIHLNTEDAMKKLLLLLGCCVILGVVLLVPVGGGKAPALSEPNPPQQTMDLSTYSSDAPAKPLEMLFIHHSVGGVWLADAGEEKPIDDNVFTSHLQGGGLRSALEKNGYAVHEASYGSQVGEATDLFDWLPKFRDQMGQVLSVKLNDEALPGDGKNQIVVFKSCYPNNRFQGDGDEPGNPTGPELTYWNARATMTALRDELAEHPETLFVYVTAPPLAPDVPKQPLWKWLVKKVLGKPQPGRIIADQGEVARRFNRWVVDPEGWLAGYPHRNLVVFDLYHVLTDEGASNHSRYAVKPGDSHPNRAGNEKATTAFVPFLNRAVRHAGLSE
jgi:hypothetical protein